jgi:hypothetical protein
LKARLGICGDPVVGRALTLLLRSSGYKATYLFAHSFGESQALKEVRLLVLTPTLELSSERRNTLMTLLKETSEAEDMPVLELVIPFALRQEEVGNESWYMVPWPCRIGDLEGWIEEAWLRHYETRGERI